MHILSSLCNHVLLEVGCAKRNLRDCAHAPFRIGILCSNAPITAEDPVRSFWHTKYSTTPPQICSVIDYESHLSLF
jgi:hypothetical protein